MAFISFIDLAFCSIRLKSKFNEKFIFTNQFMVSCPSIIARGREERFRLSRRSYFGGEKKGDEVSHFRKREGEGN